MKILILYSTKTGTVKKCAERLAKEIGGDVLVCNLADRIPELDTFDLVICGASIRMGKLDKRMKLFLDKDTQIRNKRIALFICCGMDEKSEEYLSNVFPSDISQNALIKSSFGGELKIDKQKGIDRLIAKLFLKANEENDNFVMPTIFTEEIGRFSDKIKEMST